MSPLLNCELNLHWSSIFSRPSLMYSRLVGRHSNLPLGGRKSACILHLHAVLVHEYPLKQHRCSLSQLKSVICPLFREVFLVLLRWHHVVIRMISCLLCFMILRLSTLTRELYLTYYFLDFLLIVQTYPNPNIWLRVNLPFIHTEMVR